MVVHKIPNWLCWECVISDFEKEENAHRSKNEYFSNRLFRGQKSASWNLASTLERKGIALPSIEAFSDQIKTTKLAFESYIGSSWPTDYAFTDLPAPPEDYEFMVYLRHHGYPTPLLDWTRSPHIAAFFAFQYPSDEYEVAIYSFREYVGESKSGLVGDSNIVGCGPNIRTHKRHYIQQAEYTYCRRKIDERWFYATHEQAFEEAGGRQNVLTKFVLPAAMRSEALAKLDSMNINAYTLYGSEEGLAEMLANREYGYRS